MSDTSGSHRPIQWAIEPNLSVEEFTDVLRRSTLDQRRPVDEPIRLGEMLQNAQLILTARLPAVSDDRGLLVGVARAITDYAYCTYLSDLAVDTTFQGQGIGRELIRQIHRAAGLRTRLILLAAPAAESYYPHIGMQQHSSCWQIPPLTDPS